MILNKLKKILNSKYGFILKIFFSFVILFFFFKSLNLSNIKTVLKQFSLFSIFVLISLTFFRNFIGSYRFKILSSIKSDIKFFQIVKQYFVASFFNNFLPSAIGGDGVRLLMVAQKDITKTEAGVMILLERIIGFYALITISIISSFLWDIPQKIFYLIILIYVIYSVTIVFLLKKRIDKKINKPNIVNSLKISLSIYQGKYKILLYVFILSLFYQFISIYISYYIASLIQTNCSIIPFLTLVPLVWFFTMIPISFGGVGLREISFTYLLANIGFNEEQSAVISIGTYFTLVISGLIGAIFFLKGKNEKKK